MQGHIINGFAVTKYFERETAFKWDDTFTIYKTLREAQTEAIALQLKDSKSNYYVVKVEGTLTTTTIPELKEQRDKLLELFPITDEEN